LITTLHFFLASKRPFSRIRRKRFSRI